MLQQFHIDAMVAWNCYFEVTWKQLHQYPHSLNLTDFHLHVPQVAWYHNSSSNSMHIQGLEATEAHYMILEPFWATGIHFQALSSENLLNSCCANMLNATIFSAWLTVRLTQKKWSKIVLFSILDQISVSFMFLQCPAYNLRTLLYVDPNLNPWFKSALSSEMGNFSLHFVFCCILCMIRLSARFLTFATSQRDLNLWGQNKASRLLAGSWRAQCVFQCIWEKHPEKGPLLFKKYRYDILICNDPYLIYPWYVYMLKRITMFCLQCIYRAYQFWIEVEGHDML